MSGPEIPDQGQTALERNLHLFQNADTALMTNGDPPKPDGSVDSAVSLPPAEASEQNGVPNGLSNGHSAPDAKEAPTAPQPSIEPSDAKPPPEARPQSSASKSGAEGLPLYQPPAPVSQSPEVSKKQPSLVNGHASPPAAVETNGTKRKRDSTSVTPGSKKFKMDLAAAGAVGAEQAVGEAEDRESLELARSLQQQERGLRRRS